MSGELQAYLTTGLTLYAVVIDSIGQYWNTNSEALETYNGANWTDYDVALTEAGAGGYFGTFPGALITAGVYDYIVYEQAGVSPATTDTIKGSGWVEWDGAAVIIPAGAGAQMALVDDAITSDKFDESTAFPLKADDSGSTYLARTGGDSDTLETLSDQVDAAALEATLTAMQGAGWSTETLKAIYDQVVLRLLASAYTTPPTVGQIDTQLSGTHGAGAWGGSGATAAQVWAYATRTLTQTAAQLAAIVDGSSITIMRGDTLSASLTGIGAITGYTTLDFMVKRDKADADTKAIIHIRKNASGSGDGLIRINGAAGTAGNGSLTISDLALGNITLALVASETAKLIPGLGYYYDIQKITGATVTTMTTGTFNVTPDVTMTVIP